tara:strand:+ start:3191 stop:3670 length:480 start_codon:yes stop_codon:yes gene_type:complete
MSQQHKSFIISLLFLSPALYEMSNKEKAITLPLLTWISHTPAIFSYSLKQRRYLEMYVPWSTLASIYTVISFAISKDTMNVIKGKKQYKSNKIIKNVLFHVSPSILFIWLSRDMYIRNTLNASIFMVVPLIHMVKSRELSTTITSGSAAALSFLIYKFI